MGLGLSSPIPTYSDHHSIFSLSDLTLLPSPVNFLPILEHWQKLFIHPWRFSCQGCSRPSHLRQGLPCWLVWGQGAHTPCGILSLWQEVIIKVSQEPPGLFVLCCVASPVDDRVVKDFLVASSTSPLLTGQPVAHSHNRVTLTSLSFCPNPQALNSVILLTKTQLDTFLVLPHIEGNSTTSPSWSVSLKWCVAPHANIPVTETIPPHPCNINETKALGLHTDLQFLLFV